MSAEQNRVQLNKFLTFINTADRNLGAEVVSEDAVFHIPNSPEPMRGLDGYLAVIGMMRSGFPDIRWTLEETIAEGEKIAARFEMRGTHRGEFFGVPPTGNTIAVKALNFYSFDNGKIIEEHGLPDLLGLMKQIGA